MHNLQPKVRWKRSSGFVPFMMALLILGAVQGSKSQPSEDSKAAAVTGWVVYPDGRLASNATVNAHDPQRSTGRVFGTKSKSDGSFAFEGLTAGKIYEFCASKEEDGYLDPYLIYFGLSVGRCERIMLRPGEIRSGVKLVLPKLGSLEGKLFDGQTHHPIPGAIVTLYRPMRHENGRLVLTASRSAATENHETLKSGSNGQFKFVSLPEGDYFLKVQMDGYENWFFDNKTSEDRTQLLHIRSGTSKAIMVKLLPKRS